MARSRVNWITFHTMICLLLAVSSHSYKDKTAVVTYDDTKAGVAALTRATTEAGYPSAPRS